MAAVFKRSHRPFRSAKHVLVVLFAAVLAPLLRRTPSVEAEGDDCPFLATELLGAGETGGQLGSTEAWVRGQKVTRTAPERFLE